ncbi:hypothetical protein Lalb_Chr12g0206231 [Lupinus albus]|uniref:Uncharacterized protein n=1 Tax=Lupinus albus TaxID=3870 RepID=A0A6A4PNG0_LUPAL|nr:hypothetical protein Lalb_Chr12g0206231 [Lupinus albus]
MHHVLNQNLKALVLWVFSTYKLFYSSPHIQCETSHLNNPTISPSSVGTTHFLARSPLSPQCLSRTIGSDTTCWTRLRPRSL